MTCHSPPSTTPCYTCLIKTIFITGVLFSFNGTTMDFHQSPACNIQPSSFGRYKVEKLLGEGAMGRVFLAQDPVLDRPVAIKVIAIEKQPDPRTREEYLKRFNLEARASAKLNHPSIVAIFDAGEESGTPWIAFEYVEGNQLESLLSATKPLPVEKIVAIILDITAALHHAHGSSIIHRDIKPANILIDKRTQIAKLSDFGVVKAPWIALTQDGTAVGSPGYMSPEQLDGSGADERSDLFSLGIVLYQMLTGKHPFLRDSIPATIYATLHSRYEPVTALRPDAPGYLTAITDRLLMHEPAKRFQSAAVLLHELRTGSRPPAPANTRPMAFDKEALLGNTTRLHRIAQILPAIGKKGAHRIHTLSTFPWVTSLLDRAREPGTGLLPALWPFRQRKSAPPDRKIPARLFFPALLLIASLLLLLIITLASPPPNERKIMRSLKTAGFHGTFTALIDTCGTLVRRNRFDTARELAAKLAGVRRTAAQANCCLARIALLDDKTGEVVNFLGKATGSRDWNRIKKNELPHLLQDCATVLTKESSDSAFLAGLATALGRDMKDSVAAWTRNSAYWLRWNSVRLAAILKIPVDSVDVYALDLKYAGSVRTRAHAATRLGELGDKRAVGPLQKAAELGFKDPIVSYVARQVLDNNFRDTVATGKKESDR
jgi:serine/threonine protein kinase